MSIPNVKTYLVIYYAEGKEIHRTLVSAPTKFLAKLNLRHCMVGDAATYNAWRIADRVTYTVERVKK